MAEDLWGTLPYGSVLDGADGCADWFDTGLLNEHIAEQATLNWSWIDGDAFVDVPEGQLLTPARNIGSSTAPSGWWMAPWRGVTIS